LIGIAIEDTSKQIWKGRLQIEFFIFSYFVKNIVVNEPLEKLFLIRDFFGVKIFNAN